MRKIIENTLWIAFILSLISLVILCITSNENVHMGRVCVSVFCSLLFITVIIFHYSECLFSHFSKWYHQKMEYILRMISNQCISIGERTKAKLINTRELDLLSPTILKDSKYVELLKSALDNERVHNIAITGSYGSGKSSIINTFQHLYQKYNCLNLSLASFAEEQEVQPATVETEQEGVKSKRSVNSVLYDRISL